MTAFSSNCEWVVLQHMVCPFFSHPNSWCSLRNWFSVELLLGHLCDDESPPACTTPTSHPPIPYWSPPPLRVQPCWHPRPTWLEQYQNNRKANKLPGSHLCWPTHPNCLERKLAFTLWVPLACVPMALWQLHPSEWSLSARRKQQSLSLPSCRRQMGFKCCPPPFPFDLHLWIQLHHTTF